MEPQPVRGSRNAPPEVVLAPSGAGLGQLPLPQSDRTVHRDGQQASHQEARTPILIQTYAEVALDPKTRELSLKVINASSGEVLIRWPVRAIDEIAAAHGGLTASINALA